MAQASGSPPPSPPPATAPGFAVFIDSSIDTHLALLVSPADTVAHLKRKIKAEHALCFPDIGEIKVHALKVKRRGSFYRLSDSMIVRNTFDGIKGTRFLYIDAEATCLAKGKEGIVQNTSHRDGRLLDCSADRMQDVFLNGSTGEKTRNLTDTGSIKETDNTVPDETCIKCMSLETKAIHHEFEMSPSILERSEPDLPGIHKQPNDHMAVDHGENVHSSREEERRELVAEDGDGAAATVTVKKVKGEKRSNAMQDDLLLENQSKHYPVEKKKCKRRNDSSNELVGYPLTRNNSKTSVHALKTLNLENCRLATMVHDKHNVLPDSAEGPSWKPPNDESLSPQIQSNDEKKPRKKKRLYKSVVVVESSLPPSAADTSPAHDIKESDAQAGRHKNSLNRSGDVVSLEKKSTEKKLEEASENNGIDFGKEYVAANIVEKASRKVSDDVHPEDTSGNNHQDLTNDITMVEQAVEPKSPAKFDSEDPSKISFGSSHRRKRKKSGKTEFFDHLSGIDDRSVDQAKEEKSRNLSEDHHGSPSKACEGTTVLGEAAGHIHPLTVDSEIQPRLDDRKLHRRRKNSAKKEFPNHESLEPVLVHSLGEEVAEEDPKKAFGNNHLDMGKDRKSADVGEAVALGSSPPLHSVMPSDNNDRRQHRRASDQRTGKSSKEMLVDHNHDPGKESESAVVIGDAEALDNTFVDCAVPLKPDDRRSRKSRKKSAKTEASNCDCDESENVHDLRKEATEENRGKSSHNRIGLHKESKQASSPGKESSFESLTKADEVIPSNTNGASQQAYEKNSKETLMDHRTCANKKSKRSVVLDEAAAPGNPTEVSSIVHTGWNEKKPHSSRKKSAKTEASGHEFVQPEFVQSLSNKISKRNTIKTKGTANVELEKQSKSETVTGAAVSLESSAKVDLVVPSGSVHADHQVIGESSRHTSGDHRNLGKTSRESGVLGEASTLHNPVVADSAGSPQPADKKQRRSRKKSDKTQLLNNQSVASEYVHPLGKEVAEENLERTSENDKTNLGRESKSATVFGETADAKRLIDGLVDMSGNQTVKENLGEESETKFRSSSNDPSAMILHAETVQIVEDCGKEAEQDSTLKTPPEHVEVNFKDHPKLDTDMVNFIDFFISKASNHESGSAEQLTSEAENRKLHNGKTKKRETDSYVHEQNCSQDLVNPSSSNEQHRLKGMPQDVDLAKHGLDNSLKQLPGKGQKSSKAHIGTTVERRSDSGVHLGVPVNKNYSSAHSNVHQKEVGADQVASDDTTEDDTPHQSKRYRVAVRKVPSSRMAEVMENSNWKKTMLATSSAIFDGATSESTFDEHENSNGEAYTQGAPDTSSASSGSDSEVEQPQTMTKHMSSAGIESALSGKNKKEIYGGSNGLTLSHVSRKGMPLSAILKNTNSYKKAKLTASQSQPEDSESQPIDVVLETQADSVSL